MRIDDRAGSRDLYPLLLKRGVKDCTLARFAYGDIHIIGRGPEECPVQVGIEYKKLPDLVQCIQDGRLVGHQLPGMLECYDQVWVLVEGVWKEGKQSGMVEVPANKGWKPLMAGGPHGLGLAASALQGYLLTLQIKLGLRVMLTGSSTQTVDWLYHLNRWWTEKEWEDHRAHLAFDNSQAITSLVRPSLTRRLAKELTGIGWQRSADVAKKFKTPLEMVLAEEKEWMEIKGVGKGIAKRVVGELREGR